MKKLLNVFALVTSTVFAQTSFSQEITWELVTAQSTGKGVACNPTSVQSIGAGQNLSLVFDKMSVNLMAGVDTKTLSKFGTCYVFLKMVVPQGYSIATNNSNLLGGITKDKGSTGYVDVVSTVTKVAATPAKPFASVLPIGPSVHTRRNLLASQAINEPLFELQGSANFSTLDKKRICALTATSDATLGMYVQLSVAGTRSKGTLTNIIGIDSVDNRVDLAINTEACPAH